MCSPNFVKSLLVSSEEFQEIRQLIDNTNNLLKEIDTLCEIINLELSQLN